MKRKFMSLVLALAMICSMFVPAMAADETPVTPYAIPSDVKGKVVILHTNDTHGADVAVEGDAIGMAGVAQLKKDFEAAGAKVLLLSVGDSIMGKPLVSADQGKSAIEFMNAVGYDAMTVGNHELDFGIDNLKTLAKDAKFPILCANMTVEATKKNVFDSNKIFDLDGVKVGVFGLATPETLTKADQSKMPGITFPQGEALYKVAQAQIDELKKAGADVIVCIGHLGVADESKGNQSVDVCRNTNGIDLFIDGHSHNTTAEIIKATGVDTNVINNVKVVSTGTALANVGVVVYDKTAKTLTDSLVSAASYTKVDETVAKLVNDRNTAVNELYGEKIAATEVDLNGSRSGGEETSTNGAVKVTFPKGQGNRTAETNLGDFAADAILWQARKTLGANKVDAAVTNGGGIRETLAKGNISKLDLLAVFPFGNTVATITVTGAELLESLEAATWSTPDAIGAFPQVSGINFIVNTAVPYVNGDQYPGSTYYAPKEPGARVTIATVGDKAFDKNATYTIATNDFTAKGGDTFGAFKRVGGWKDVGVSLEDALINYTTEELKGVITAEKYGETADRILIIPADVSTGVWYTDAVHYVLAEGIMKGTSGGSFSPSGTVTRATVYQMLYNMEGKPAVAEDVAVADAAGKWYSDAVRWAKSVGIFEGESFGEDAVIVRAEIADILSNYAIMNNILVDTSGMAMKEAADYDKIPAEYLGGITFCYYAGIMTGNQSGLLLPNDSLTRDVLAQVMFKFDKLTPTYTEEVVEIKVPATSGVPAHTMVGTLTVPTSATKDAKAPAVVMLHGTGSNRDEAGMGYAIAASAMALDGIATLRVDFMGTAADDAANYKYYSYTSANIDAKAAADYLAKLENIDGKNLGVMGWSQGGTNALLSAAKYPTTFKSVVTWAGALDLTGLFGETKFDDAYATAKKDGAYTMKLDWRTPSELPVGVKWFEDVKNTDILKEVAKIKAPVLAIQGADDAVVAPESAAEIIAASKNTASDSHLIEKCDHTFNVFSGDFTALNDAISAGTAFFMDSFGMIADEVAPAA